MQRTTLVAIAGLLTAFIANVAVNYGIEFTPEQRAEITEAIVNLMVAGGLLVPAFVAWRRERKGVAPIILPKDEVKQLKEGAAEVKPVNDQSGYAHVRALWPTLCAILLVLAILPSCASVSVPKQLQATAVAIEQAADEIATAKVNGLITDDQRDLLVERLRLVQSAAHVARETYFYKGDKAGARVALENTATALDSLRVELGKLKGARGNAYQ